jgi:hypothetical protein
VRIVDGQLSVVDGPFVEAKEVIGGYAVFELHSKEEAVASAVEFMQLHKDFIPWWPPSKRGSSQEFRKGPAPG